MTGARPRWDVVIIGAGPAGSTAAALLADAGCRVVVLEKDAFPRFHIGESLLPAGLPIHERLGVVPDCEVSVFKGGAEFICEATGRRAAFSFAEALPGAPQSAFHVDRARFDTLLRDRARAGGATVRHGEKVVDIDISADEVRVKTASGVVRGRYLIDATGQDRLLARRSKQVVPFRRFGKAAVSTHYEGVSDAAMAEIGPNHDVRVFLRPRGWGWIIPLPGRRLSVGLASQDSGVSPTWLDEYAESSPILARLSAGATRLETRVVRNFSYKNAAPHGRRYACVGDASCFLDPVFSSGVALAMIGAARLADLLVPALAAGAEGDAALAAPIDDHMERAYATFGSLIDRFYNTRFADNFFFGAPKDGALRAGVVSVLAGDVWRDDNPFQDKLLRAVRRGTTIARRPSIR